MEVTATFHPVASPSGECQEAQIEIHPYGERYPADMVAALGPMGFRPIIADRVPRSCVEKAAGRAFVEIGICHEEEKSYVTGFESKRIPITSAKAESEKLLKIGIKCFKGSPIK